MSKQLLNRGLWNKWTIAALGLGLTTLVISTAYGIRSLSSTRTAETETLTQPLAPVESISALGRIEPWGEVIEVSAPPALGGAKVEELLVAEGDTIAARQIIARLDNYDRLQAAVVKARRDVEVAQAELAITRRGAKQGEIAAAEAAVRRLEAQQAGDRATDQARVQELQAERNNAETEYRRYQQLFANGAVSEFERDRYQLALATTEERLQQAQADAERNETTRDREIQQAEADLARIREIRPVDIARDEARVRQAQAVLQQAEADLELGIVRSPVAGQVLKINTFPGEAVSLEAGIVEVGRTDRMVVVAEVYESDISLVQTDQVARITSENNAFSGELQGKVSAIGLQIGKKAVLDTDPAADVDVRVVEVDIELDAPSSQKVAHLTNAKVLVEIQR